MTQTMQVSWEREEWTAEVEGERVTLGDDGTAFTVREESGGRFVVQGPSRSYTMVTAPAGDSVWVGVDGHALEFRLARGGDRVRSSARDHDALTPPMSATVVRIQVRPGDQVQTGDTLVILEAMKMELPIRAPRAATVRAVHCTEGQLVQPDLVLVELD